MITYVVRDIQGNIEPFTGEFETKEEADIWYKKYGKMWTEKGYSLIRRYTKSS